jgi:tetratricopeptide (TPR) repeat protein
MLHSLLSLMLWTFVAQETIQTGASDNNFMAAKQLYAAGNYEEALSRLTTATAEGGAAEVNQYRALCLLALGRTADAERSLEDLVTQRPLFKMSEADVSPRVVAMFHDVRKRLLPGATRDLYARARTNYDQKLYSRAANEFKEVLQLLVDPDLGKDAAALSDLKMIAEGFLKLAEVEIAASVKAEIDAAAARKVEAAAEAPKPPPVPTGPRIYTDADKDVTPPVDIGPRTLPEWKPPAGAAGQFEYRGVLRLLIDEQGNVEQAALVQRVTESYDPLILAAARNWTFRPARKNGQPVKYQKLIGITLLPR